MSKGKKKKPSKEENSGVKLEVLGIGNGNAQNNDLLEYLIGFQEIIYEAPVGGQAKSVRVTGTSLKSLFGYTDKEYHALLNSDRIRERFHPDDVEIVTSKAIAVRAGSGPQEMEYRFKKKNAKSYTWFQERMFARTNEKGEIDSIIGSVRELGEDPLGTGRQQEERKHYHSLFNHSVNLLLVVDLNGVVVDVNETTCAHLQCDKKTIGSRHLSELCQGEANVKTVKDQLKKLKSKGGKVEFEWQITGKKGRTTDLEVVMHKGRFFGAEVYIANCRDITERVNFEAEVKASQEKLDLVLKSIPEMFYNVSHNGEERRIEYISPQIKEVLGLSVKEYEKKLMNGSIYDLYHPEDLERYRKIVLEKDPTEVSHIFTYRFKKKGGKDYVWIEETVYPRYDGEGKRTSTYGVLRDVTRRHRDQLALQHSERRFRALFERNLAGVFRTTLKGEIVEANDAYAKALGYASRAEVIGQNIIDHYVDKKTRKETVKRLQKQGFLTSVPGHFFKKDGVETHLLANLALVETEKGDQLMEGTLIEITDYVRTAELLEKREKSYRDLIENSPYAILIHKRGEVLFGNKRALEISGYDSLDEILGQNIMDLLTIDQKDFVYQQFDDLSAVDDKEHVELQVRNKKGRQVMIDFKAMLCDWEGVPAVQVAFRDITDKLKLEKEIVRSKEIEEANEKLKKEIRERKKAEDKLLENQAYTRNLIESSLDMICAINEKDQIVEFNKAAQARFGYSADEILGKSISILYYNERERKSVLAHLEDHGSYQGEVVNRTKSGEKFLSYLSASMLYDESGNVVGAMGVSRDITKAREAKQKELVQAAKLKAIVEGRSHLIWTVNGDNELVLFNRNFYEFYKQNFRKRIGEGDVPWDDLDQLLTEDQKDIMAERYERAFEGKEQFFEVQFRNERGMDVWMEIHLNPIKIQEKDVRVFEVSSIAQDITDKKQAEDSIQASLKEKEVLLQEIHHRVKNNLQVISSILNLQSSYIKDSKIVNILRESQNRIKSMAFIHESLYGAKDFSSINFSDYVKNLAQNLIYSYRIQEDKVKLSLKLKPVHLPLDSAIPCGLIINELVSNALKYAFPDDKKGKVEIQLYLKNDRVHLHVADDGIGLPDDFNLEQTESLGLQLVSTLAEQLSASMEIENDKGTSFNLIFDHIQ